MITIREETIGPERAMEMLKLNTGNRNVKPVWVNRLAESMRKGEWKFNGDTIRMNGNRLIDGQHRLHAIVKSGVHLRTLIVDGLDSSVFDTIDIGKTRTGSDTLNALGEKNTTTLAATVRIVHNYDEIVKGLATTSFKDSILDNSDLIHKIESYPDIRGSVNRCCGKKNFRAISPAIQAALHYVFSRIDATLADEFIRCLETGYSEHKKDPFLSFRERIIGMSFGSSKPTRESTIALAIKAWNKKRAGDQATLLRYEPNRESFPIAK